MVRPSGQKQTPEQGCVSFNEALSDGEVKWGCSYSAMEETRDIKEEYAAIVKLPLVDQNSLQRKCVTHDRQFRRKKKKRRFKHQTVNHCFHPPSHILSVQSVLNFCFPSLGFPCGLKLVCVCVCVCVSRSTCPGFPAKLSQVTVVVTEWSSAWFTEPLLAAAPPLFDYLLLSHRLNLLIRCVIDPAGGCAVSH